MSNDATYAQTLAARDSPELEPAAAAHGALAQAERFRRDLQQFVLADPLEALLEVHDARRRELDALVGRGGAFVGAVFFLRVVRGRVFVGGVLADDRALVARLPGRHEHRAARREVVDGVAGRLAAAAGDERAVLTVRDVALPFVPAVEQ